MKLGLENKKKQRITDLRSYSELRGNAMRKIIILVNILLQWRDTVTTATLILKIKKKHYIWINILTVSEFQSIIIMAGDLVACK